MLSGIFRRAPKPVENEQNRHPEKLGSSIENLPEQSNAKDSSVQTSGVAGEPDLKDAEEDSKSLLHWWSTVEGWDQWNETVQVQEDEDKVMVEQAADRVYMAARLFVRLLQQRGDSLQRRVHELRSLADAADGFHKRTVAASVGGGVASVAGGVVTISGLILAPFTFGTSLIVTAVGIGVATAGGLTSASANITDTVHSNMDRKKVERMIQDYQEEIKDIKECLEFLQEGMDVLRRWDFEDYMESLSRQALNQNVKHVMKEGGRAGKALLTNTESLVSTVQVLSTAGGAARAAQAVSVATGVMSALFLALDVFFLAKDSHELRAGAKTRFAAKIREVCTELEDGLQELLRIRAELQKTMEGTEQEGGGEEEEEAWDTKEEELALLEKELDQMEDELDRRALMKQAGEGQGQSEEERKRSKGVKTDGEKDRVGAGVLIHNGRRAGKCDIETEDGEKVSLSGARPRANAFCYSAGSGQHEEAWHGEDTLLTDANSESTAITQKQTLHS